MHRKKSPTQWVVCKDWNTTLTSVVGAPGVTELVGATSVAAAGFDPPIIQRFTVVCVRGQLMPLSISFNAGGGVWTLGCGIIKLRTNVAGFATATFPNPNSQGDAGADWLWLRQFTFGVQSVGAGAQQVTDHYLTTAAAPGASYRDSSLSQFVNVASKRTMREGEALALVCSLSGTAGGVVSWTPYLRSLIKRVA